MTSKELWELYIQEVAYHMPRIARLIWLWLPGILIIVAAQRSLFEIVHGG